LSALIDFRAKQKAKFQKDTRRGVGTGGGSWRGILEQEQDQEQQQEQEWLA